MFLSPIRIILTAAGTAQSILAHTAFTNFFIDGIDQGDGVAVRMSNISSQATSPLPNITVPEMACGVNGEEGVARVASANAGSTLVFEWRDWPDGSVPGSIDPSHKGPCAVYMKKVNDSTASNNAAGDGWFKITEVGYDSNSNQWCTEKLIPNDGHLAATIPKDLAPGYYLVRPEVLALHQADKNPPDPQFYVGCAQIFLKSTGTATPTDLVSIPGYVNLSTPAMTYNVWRTPLALPFPDFGPPLYTGSSSQSTQQKFSAKTIIQESGLKPAGCVLENANWCGFMPPTYTDQIHCYASHANCSAQLDVCYKSAPPSGSKNCHVFERFCEDIQAACSSQAASGPPSFSSYKTAPLPIELPVFGNASSFFWGGKSGFRFSPCRYTFLKRIPLDWRVSRQMWQ